MLAKIFLLALFVQATLASSLNSEFMSHLWDNYKQMHGKFYQSHEVDTVRREIFRRNVDYIEKHNTEASMGIHSYTLGINQFADLTIEEFREQYLGTKLNLTQVKGMYTHKFVRLPEEVQLPDSIDWREKGAVTPVKDQGQCGSCWSFSATGALEGAWFRAKNLLVSLSEQQLVDCSNSYGNQGCNGGLMDNAFHYAKDVGMNSEDSYPYKAVQGSCRAKSRNIVANCSGFVDVSSDNEDALEEAVSTVGPISVAIDATQENFMLYKSGVFFDDTCGNKEDELDHGVLVVGYGTEASGDYWIVKNSWSETWGEMGYIRMARNHKNMCGIATQASYPLVK